MFRSSQRILCRRTLRLLDGLDFSRVDSVVDANSGSSGPYDAATNGRTTASRTAPLVCPYFYSHTSVHTTSTPRRNSHFAICPKAYQHLVTDRPRHTGRHLTGGSHRSVHVTATSAAVAFRSRMFNARRCGLTRSVNSVVIHHSSNVCSCRLTIAISSLSVNVASVIHNHSLLHSGTLRVCVHGTLVGTKFGPSRPARPFRPTSNSGGPSSIAVSCTRLPLVSGTTNRHLTGHRHSLSLNVLATRNTATRRVVNCYT